MNAMHTKGPWQRDGQGCTISAPSGVICECWSHMGTEEAVANEKLIAAAPELLDALQSAQMALMGYLHQNDITLSALAKARAAIAKATGA